MYQKPGDGLGSARDRKVEASIRLRKPLTGSDVTARARRALEEASRVRASRQRHQQNIAAMGRVAEAARHHNDQLED